MVASGKDKPNGPEAFLDLFTTHNRSLFHFILTLAPNWNDGEARFLTLVATDSQGGNKGVCRYLRGWACVWRA